MHKQAEGMAVDGLPVRAQQLTNICMARGQDQMHMVQLHGGVYSKLSYYRSFLSTKSAAFVPCNTF